MPWLVENHGLQTSLALGLLTVTHGTDIKSVQIFEKCMRVPGVTACVSRLLEDMEKLQDEQGLSITD